MASRAQLADSTPLLDLLRSDQPKPTDFIEDAVLLTSSGKTAHIQYGLEFQQVDLLGKVRQRIAKTWSKALLLLQEGAILPDTCTVRYDSEAVGRLKLANVLVSTGYLRRPRLSLQRIPGVVAQSGDILHPIFNPVRSYIRIQLRSLGEESVEIAQEGAQESKFSVTSACLVVPEAEVIDLERRASTLRNAMNAVAEWWKQRSTVAALVRQALDAQAASSPTNVVPDPALTLQGLIDSDMPLPTVSPADVPYLLPEVGVVRLAGLAMRRTRRGGWDPTRYPHTWQKAREYRGGNPFAVAEVYTSDPKSTRFIDASELLVPAWYTSMQPLTVADLPGEIVFQAEFRHRNHVGKVAAQPTSASRLGLEFVEQPTPDLLYPNGLSAQELFVATAAELAELHQLLARLTEAWDSLDSLDSLSWSKRYPDLGTVIQSLVAADMPPEPAQAPLPPRYKGQVTVPLRELLEADYPLPTPFITDPDYVLSSGAVVRLIGAHVGSNPRRPATWREARALYRDGMPPTLVVRYPSGVEKVVTSRELYVPAHYLEHPASTTDVIPSFAIERHFDYHAAKTHVAITRGGSTGSPGDRRPDSQDLELAADATLLELEEIISSLKSAHARLDQWLQAHRS